MVEPFSVSLVIWLTSVNIQMAAWLSGEHLCAKIIDYLLHIAGGSIDVSDLQYWIWIGFADFPDGHLAGAKLVGCRWAVMTSEYPQRHMIYSLLSSTASRPSSELLMQSSLLKYSNLDHVKD